MSNRPILYLGNKNYSSWSMRPWLALRWAGIDFEERVIPLGMDGYGKSVVPEILAASPSGRVPCLDLGGEKIWDSMAICEWAAEQKPDLWPADPMARAMARSAAAEMHAGFSALRRELPMNVRRRAGARAIGADAQGDIERIVDLWTGLRARFEGGGIFLFGQRGIADAFYAPIATRFRTYAVGLPQIAEMYCQTLLADPEVAAWNEGAEQEAWSLEAVDAF